MKTLHALALPMLLTISTAALAQNSSDPAPPIAPSPSLPATVQASAGAEMRADDRKEDERRKGPEIVAAIGVQPGQAVADLLPGGGYWTRLFSGVVGAKGKVYDVWTAASVAPGGRAEARMATLKNDPGLKNVTQVPVDFAKFAVPTPVDVVFTSQNLHDLPNEGFGRIDITAFSRAVLASLKPGGKFVVIDHAGAAGTGQTQTDTLHRIEPAFARAKVEAAGFRFVSESKLLAHPADTHDKAVFDTSLRGYTDQFIYIFQKPTK